MNKTQQRLNISEFMIYTPFERPPEAIFQTHYLKYTETVY